MERIANGKPNNGRIGKIIPNRTMPRLVKKQTGSVVSFEDSPFRNLVEKYNDAVLPKKIPR